AGPGGGRRALRHADPRVQERLLMGNFLTWVIWLLAAAACLGTGLRVVAAAQVLVYAGAVMVMFLFVIAYLGGRADAPWAGGTRLIQVSSVIAAVSLLAVTLVAVGLETGDQLSNEGDVTRAFGSPAAVGELFLTDHLLAFEITSIVLLVAAIGGVVLAMRSQSEQDADRPEAA